MLEMLMDSIDRVIVVCHEGHLVGGDTTLPPNFPLRSIFFGSGAMFRIFSISWSFRYVVLYQWASQDQPFCSFHKEAVYLCYAQDPRHHEEIWGIQQESLEIAEKKEGTLWCHDVCSRTNARYNARLDDFRTSDRVFQESLPGDGEGGQVLWRQAYHFQYAGRHVHGQHCIGWVGARLPGLE